MTDPKTPRRRSLLKGAAVAAGAMSAPMVAVAQTTSFRFQSTWPAKDIFHEYAQRLRQEGERHGGQPPEDRGAALRRGGAGVPAAGSGEQGHAGRRPRRGGLPLRQELRAGPVGLGPGLRHGPQHGAGLALLRRRQGAAGRDLQVHQHGRGLLPVRPACPRQPLGWFKKPVSNVDAAQGPEVPHRGPGGRRVQGTGRRR